MRLDLQQIPKIAPGYRLQWEPAQECQVLLYPEGMVQLNDAAGAILEQCDGQRSLTQVIQVLNDEFGDAETDLQDDVVEFVEEAIDRGWLRLG